MAERGRQVERAREALEEKRKEDRIEEGQDQRAGEDRPQDEPDPPKESAGQGEESADQRDQ
jgi:hypothetical protein